MPFQGALTGEDVRIPYANFAFHVMIDPVAGTFAPGDGLDAGLIGAFSEVSGIEAMMEHKVIKVGGFNYGAQMRAGPVTFGTVVLKRGIVKSQHLWRWWEMFAGAGETATDARPTLENRGNVLIGLVRAFDEGDEAEERKVRLGWRLRNAMPVKFRVGDLNAKGSDVAVEEIHLVHEGLEMSGVVA
jgi:phage tail-like protein